MLIAVVQNRFHYNQQLYIPGIRNDHARGTTGRLPTINFTSEAIGAVTEHEEEAGARLGFC